MSAQFSCANTPQRRRRTVKVAKSSLDDELIEYPMRELAEGEYQAVRQSVLHARDRIKANGGKFGPSTIDKHADRPPSAEWAKGLLKPSSRKWSFNEATELCDALIKCEIARAAELLRKKNGGISERELRHRYEDWCKNARANPFAKDDASKLVVSGISAPPDVTMTYDVWVHVNADCETLNQLHATHFGLICRQVWASGPKHGECACALRIARSLTDQGAIAGARKRQCRRAYDALIKSFAEYGFRDRCTRNQCPIGFSKEARL